MFGDRSIRSLLYFFTSFFIVRFITRSVIKFIRKNSASYSEFKKLDYRGPIKEKNEVEKKVEEIGREDLVVLRISTKNFLDKINSRLSVLISFYLSRYKKILFIINDKTDIDLLKKLKSIDNKNFHFVVISVVDFNRYEGAVKGTNLPLGYKDYKENLFNVNNKIYYADL